MVIIATVPKSLSIMQQTQFSCVSFGGSGFSCPLYPSGVGCQYWNIPEGSVKVPSLKKNVIDIKIVWVENLDSSILEEKIVSTQRAYSFWGRPSWVDKFIDSWYCLIANIHHFLNYDNILGITGFLFQYNFLNATGFMAISMWQFSAGCHCALWSTKSTLHIDLEFFCRSCCWNKSK